MQRKRQKRRLKREKPRRHKKILSPMNLRMMMNQNMIVVPAGAVSAPQQRKHQIQLMKMIQRPIMMICELHKIECIEFV